LGFFRETREKFDLLYLIFYIVFLKKQDFAKVFSLTEEEKPDGKTLL